MTEPDKMKRMLSNMRQNKPAGLTSNVDNLYVRDGETHTLRVLPGEWGTNKMWYVETCTHWLPGGNQGKDLPHLCLRQHGDKPCKACEWWDKLREVDKKSLGDGTTPESKRQLERFEALVKRLSYRRSYKMAVVKRNLQDPSQDRQLVYPAPTTVFSQIFEQVEKNLEQGIWMFDPEDGHDITVMRQDDKGSTTYKVSTLLRTSSAGSSGGTPWMAQLLDLDKMMLADVASAVKYESKFVDTVDRLAAPVWAWVTSTGGGKSARDLLLESDDDIPMGDDGGHDHGGDVEDHDLASAQERARAMFGGGDDLESLQASADNLP